MTSWTLVLAGMFDGEIVPIAGCAHDARDGVTECDDVGGADRIVGLGLRNGTALRARVARRQADYREDGEAPPENS